MFSLLSYQEQFNKHVVIDNLLLEKPLNIFFPKKRNGEDYKCVAISPGENGYHHVQLSYFIGVDWINSEKAIYVEPKLNEGSKQTNYLKMLFDALKHPEVAEYCGELFDIKFTEPYIEIQRQQDLLTPLLVVQFLHIVKEIVRKGLKKSYYKVEQDLRNRIKGKILVGQTIKHNLVRNKPLNIICSYEEFGLNGIENRLLRKALTFVQRYLPTINVHFAKYTAEVFNYINPAFEKVSEEVNLNDIKHTKTNAFYKEYGEGIHLAKLILKRFGYNISNTQEQEKVKTPPFWIDMSKLFELYTLGLLKDRFGSGVIYHYRRNYNELDYLLNKDGFQMVIDAKYKKKYKDSYKIEDIRQVSGYARLKSVYDELGKNYNEVNDCLIIYPDQIDGHIDLKGIDFKDDKYKIEQFVQFYKIPIRLPLVS